MRIKRGVNAVKKRRKILKQAKGYRGAKSKLYRIARQAVMKSGNYAYVGRKLKKRAFVPRLEQRSGSRHRNVIARQSRKRERNVRLRFSLIPERPVPEREILKRPLVVAHAVQLHRPVPLMHDIKHVRGLRKRKRVEVRLKIRRNKLVRLSVLRYLRAVPEKAHILIPELKHISLVDGILELDETAAPLRLRDEPHAGPLRNAAVRMNDKILAPRKPRRILRQIGPPVKRRRNLASRERSLNRINPHTPTPSPSDTRRPTRAGLPYTRLRPPPRRARQPRGRNSPDARAYLYSRPKARRKAP